MSFPDIPFYSPDEDATEASDRGETGAASGLTRPQRTILDAILFFIRKGEIPTVREVGSLAGLRSSSTALKHLRALERAGLISLSGKSRGIRIADQTLLEEVEERSARASPGRPSPLSPPFVPVVSPQLRGGDGRRGYRSIPLVGAIAAGKPFESYPDSYDVPDTLPADFPDPDEVSPRSPAAAKLPIDPGLFGESGGDIIALRVEGDSMVNAGILSGDYVIIRRQNTVEEGEIAAVIINGEGTLKRWSTCSEGRKKAINLLPANDGFEPIHLTEEDQKDILVFGKYVGLVRGNLRL
jgi:repressor LexA